MNAFVLHELDERAGMGRWAISAILILAVHAGLIALGIRLYDRFSPPGVALPTIMVDMTPASAAPEVSPQDLAPGPTMQEADAPPPEEAPKQQMVQEEIAPTPPQDKPEVEAPPEQKTQRAP